MPAILDEVLFGLEIAGVSDAWRVLRVSASERLSEPFECEVEAAPSEALDDLASLPGRAATVRLWRGEAQARARRFTGVVLRAIDRGTSVGQRVVSLTVVPSLWLLSQRSDCRVFQDMTAREVVTEVLRDAGLYGDGTEVDWRVESGALSPREYCTQYNETDLEFVRRLLEDEGLTFYFDPASDDERLVVIDGGRDRAFAERVEGAAPVMGAGGATAAFETVRSVEDLCEVVPEGVVLRDHDFTRPDLKLHQRASAEGGRNVLYEHPARVNLQGYSASSKQYARDDGRRLAGARLEEVRAGRARVQCRSNLAGLAAGDVVRVMREGASEADVLLVVAVEHRGESHELVLREERADPFDRYSNDFEAVPAATPWRPPRSSPRPRALSPQVAVVAALSEGSSDTIVTDAYGRVLVRFRWDWLKERAQAYQTGSARSSCWLRVAQPWAGAGWGFVFIPRVGMEVLVQFVDGDPDRPVVTGCLYNGTHPPPLQLDEEKSRSVIRTQSTGGDGYNELLFEDLAGHELVALRAQRDHTVDVLHDRAVTVKNDDAVTVERDATLTVKGKRKVTVTGDRTTSLEARETVTVGGDLTLTVHGGALSQVAGEHRLSADEGFTAESGGNSAATLAPDGATLKAAKITVQATERLTLQCGGSVVEISAQGVKVTAADGTGLDVQAASATLKSAAGAQLALQGPQAQLTSPAVTTVQGALVKIN